MDNGKKFTDKFSNKGKIPIEIMGKYHVGKPDMFKVSLSKFKLKDKFNLDTHKMVLSN